MFRSEFSSPKNVPLPNFSNAKQCQQAVRLCPGYGEFLILLDSKTEGGTLADSDTFKPGVSMGSLIGLQVWHQDLLRRKNC